MVRVFQTFASERQLQKLIAGKFEVQSANDYVPTKDDPDYVAHRDVPWVKRFAAAEGKAIISGNPDMKRQPHERLALIECGMIVIFFEGQWSGWKFFRKCALLLHWWPVIASKLKGAKPGSFWHVPCNYPETGRLRSVSNKDPRALKLERRKRVARPTRRPNAKAGPVGNVTLGPLFDFGDGNLPPVTRVEIAQPQKPARTKCSPKDNASKQ